MIYLSLWEYVDEMIEHKRRPIDIEAEIPADAEVVEEAIALVDLFF